MTCSAGTGSSVGSAFGLELLSTFSVRGLAAGEFASASRPRVALSLTSAAELEIRRGEQRVLFEQPLPRGSFAVGTGTDGTHWLDHTYYGTFRVLEDGSEIACAPNDVADWVWQRFLIAQALPLASLLHGYEPVHASAVVLGGRALLLMGTSGAGKSSVALQLTAHGAAFLADDVTALELHDGVVMAHPGPPLASLDPRGLHGVPLWQSLGELEGESRIVVADAASESLPVGAVYVLTRSADVRSIEIAPPVSGPSKVLLGGTFNAYLRSPSRLGRQLEIMGRVAETAAVSQMRVPMDVDARAAAEAIASEVAS